MDELERQKRLADVSEQLRKEEEELIFSRSEEGKQVRALEEKIQKTKDLRREEEELGKTQEKLREELKESLLAPFKSMLEMIPKPIRILGKMGANKLKTLFGQQDTSKDTEKAIEQRAARSDAVGNLDIDLNPFSGIMKFFSGIKNTAKKISDFVKKFVSWKVAIVAVIGLIIGGLAIKYWEPIKELVLEIKDKVLGLYNKIKDWFMSIWNWGVATGTDEDGEWSVTTFITNIYNTIKDWFVAAWTWASDGVAAGWTTVTDYIKGIWTAVKNWFTRIWAWGEEDPSGDWKLSTFIANIFTGMRDWFFGLFGLSRDRTELDWDTGEMKTIKGNWSFSGLIRKIFTGLRDWFFGLFGLSRDRTELDWDTGEMQTIKGNWSFSGLIRKIFTGMRDWFFGLFGLSRDRTELDWDTGEMQTIKGNWSFSGLITKIFTGLRDWFFGLFGLSRDRTELDWDTGEMKTIKGNWSLSGLMMKVVRSIGDFFWNEDGTGLLNFGMKLPEFSFPSISLDSFVDKLKAFIRPLVEKIPSLLLPDSLAEWVGIDPKAKEREAKLASLEAEKQGIMSELNSTEVSPEDAMSPRQEDLYKRLEEIKKEEEGLTRNETYNSEYAKKEERVNNLTLKQEQLRKLRDNGGLTPEGEAQLAQLDKEIARERKELRAMSGHTKGTSGTTLAQDGTRVEDAKRSKGYIQPTMRELGQLSNKMLEEERNPEAYIKSLVSTSAGPAGALNQASFAGAGAGGSGVTVANANINAGTSVTNNTTINTKPKDSDTYTSKQKRTERANW